ncbi:MAG: addiction module protein [Campylobacterota bacterium]|nr:addiction module protein [Campylobacterota bacterium]
MSINEILKSALILPIDERIIITDMLTQSLNPMDKEIEKNWIYEVEQRLQLLDKGELKTISAEEFFDEN